MAKKSQLARDRKREELIDKHRARRAEIRKMMRDPELDLGQKLELQKQFAKLGTNSCPTRRTRRCFHTGRARGYNRKFGLSRIALRQLALSGELPGVTKASW
jgi:small subunit ribosomal protein S14